MTHRTRAVFIGLWLASLFAVATLARGQYRALEPLDEPVRLTGDDVGFRIEGFVGDSPAGTIVIRYRGEWVEARLQHEMAPRLVR